MMKKVLVFMMMWCTLVPFAFAGDVVTQDVQQLPAMARHFIEDYFGQTTVSYIKVDSEFLQSRKYEVLLSDRTELEFNSKGQWLEVDCKQKAVPAALVPLYARQYVEKRFPQEIITKIENKRGVEIELSNDLTFRFNPKGEVVEIDD